MVGVWGEYLVDANPMLPTLRPRAGFRSWPSEGEKIITGKIFRENGLKIWQRESAGTEFWMAGRSMVHHRAGSFGDKCLFAARGDGETFGTYILGSLLGETVDGLLKAL